VEVNEPKTSHGESREVLQLFSNITLVPLALPLQGDDKISPEQVDKRAMRFCS